MTDKIKAAPASGLFMVFQQSWAIAYRTRDGFHKQSNGEKIDAADITHWHPLPDLEAAYRVPPAPAEPHLYGEYDVTGAAVM